MKAILILAVDDRCTTPVFGVPALRRLVILGRQACPDTAMHIVSRAGFISATVSDLVPAGMLHVVTDISELIPIIEGLDVRKEDRVLVMDSAHVIDRPSLAVMLCAESSADIVFCASDDEENAECSMGVYTAKAGKLVQILDKYWIHSGIYSGEPVTGERVRVTPGLPFRIGKNGVGVDAAEKRLLNALRLATNEHEYGYLARLVGRPLSRCISAKLAGLQVSPNGITLFNIITGVIGALFLGIGEYKWQLAGAFLFLCSVVADGVDGEVARLNLRETSFGHYLDIIGDNVVHAAVFIGMAVGLYRATYDSIYIHFLVWLLGGFALCLFAVHKVTGHRPDKPGTSRVARPIALFVNRDFAYLVFVLAVINHLDWFVLAGAAGVYVFALYLFTAARMGKSIRRRPLQECVNRYPQAPARKKSDAGSREILRN